MSVNNSNTIQKLKRVMITFCIFIILFGCFNVNSVYSAGKKLALIIAIANYPEGTGFDKLSSDRDMQLILSALKFQGFKDENITFLQDENATKDGIIKAVQDLTAKTNKGDIVVIHYSGHGQQWVDDNGDEIDGADECLVPYGAYSHPKLSAGYNGDNHLRDDKIGELMDALREKAGKDGNIILFVDACYSGTITRGTDEAPSRGAPAYFPDGFVPPNITENDRGGLFEIPKSRSDTDDQTGDAAPYIVYSAASCNEQDKETTDENGKTVGPLSLALSIALQKTIADMTYRGLFEEIKEIMVAKVPQQKPQMEGNVDTKLFSGDIVAQKPYYTVKEIKDNAIYLNGGNLNGLFDGCVVSFFNAGTTDPSKSSPIIKGEVSASDELNAEVKTGQTIEPDKILKSWVFVTEQTFGETRIKVKIGGLKDGKFKSSLIESLGKNKIINIVDSNPDLLITDDDGVKNRSSNSVLVKSYSDAIIREIPYSTSDISNQVNIFVKSMARARYIKNINMNDSKLKFKLEIIPVKTEVKFGKTKVTETLDMKDFTTEGNGYRFKEGDWFQLKVTNEGEKGAYITILDITANDSLIILFPGFDSKTGLEMDISVSDRYLEKGKSFILPGITYYFTPPFGLETFKLIATTEPVDFRPIVSSEGTTRGSRSPFENLLADIYSGTRAGGSITSGNGVTATLTIDVVPR